jgi:hypothetical protein
VEWHGFLLKNVLLESVGGDLKKIKSANRLPVMAIPDYFCASADGILAFPATLD